MPPEQRDQLQASARTRQPTAHGSRPLFALTEHAEQTRCPRVGYRRCNRLSPRAAGQRWAGESHLRSRAQERYAAEQAAYDAKVRERDAEAAQALQPASSPPPPGPRDKDQYNFTDPESRIMKTATTDGFDQHDNAEAAVEQHTFLDRSPLPVQPSQRSSRGHPHLGCHPCALGKAKARALDNGYSAHQHRGNGSAGHVSRTSPRGGHPVIPSRR